MNQIPSEVLTDTTVEFSITPSADRKVSDGYSYVFKLGGTSVLSITGTPNNDIIDFKIEADATTAFVTGVYFYQIFAEKNTDRYFITGDQLRVNKIIGDSGAYDGRTVAAKILDAIDAVLLGRATTDQQSYTIQSGAGSRSLSRIPVTELRLLRKDYAGIVAAELRGKRGDSLFTTHLVEFVKP